MKTVIQGTKTDIRLVKSDTDILLMEPEDRVILWIDRATGIIHLNNDPQGIFTTIRYGDDGFPVLEK